ncbi:MAG TPA: hypothetical protein VGP72_02490 [Planctomycetota bacterium]|jgi:hypothetical protein
MSDEKRKRIDPERRYPSDGFTTAEEHALIVLDSLPHAEIERTRDVFQFTEGGDAGIVVVVTAEAVELRLPTVEWTCGSYGPAQASRLWKRVKWNEDTGTRLPELIEAARKARQREYRTCKFCGERVAPENRHSRDVCHGCAEERLGVVH